MTFHEPYPVAAQGRPAHTVLRHHPRSTGALVVGLVSVAGVIVLVPVVLGPVAWYLGAAARREIDRSPGRWAGRGQATAGMTLGILGTVLMLVAVVVAAVIALGTGLAFSIDTGYGA